MMFSAGGESPPRAVITGTGTSSLKIWTIEPGSTTLVSRTTPNLSTFGITSATASFAALWDGRYFFVAATESTEIFGVHVAILRSPNGITWTKVHDFITSGSPGRISSDGQGIVHYGFGTLTADEVDFVKSTNFGASFTGTAIITPHMFYHGQYPNGDLFMHPNDSTSGIMYFARRSKTDQSIITRYPAATPLSILSGHWCYFKSRDSFYGDQAAGAGGIYEINADLLSASVQRKTAVNSAWAIRNSNIAGQTGSRLWMIDSVGAPATWTYWYTENGTTWTNNGSWATGFSINFPFYGSQSRNRLGMASVGGDVRYTWDNGATFNTTNLGAAQNCTICI